jgi:hypothetical protein
MPVFNFCVAPQNAETFASALRARVREHAVGPCGLTRSSDRGADVYHGGDTAYVAVWLGMNRNGVSVVTVEVSSFSGARDYAVRVVHRGFPEAEVPIPEATMSDVVDAINSALALHGLPVMEMSYVLK